GLNGYSNPRAIALIDQLQSRFASNPGVSSVGAADLPVLGGGVRSSNVTVEGYPNIPEELENVSRLRLSPAYFSTLGIPLISGSEFSASDTQNSTKVAVVSETFAKRFFPKRSPIGAHFTFGGGKGRVPDIEIVGVARDVKQDHVNSDNQPYSYVP